MTNTEQERRHAIEPCPEPGDRRPTLRARVLGGLLVVLILVVALVLRVWYVKTLPGQAGVDLIYSDMKAYDYSGWQMVQGLPVTGEPGLNGYHPLSASTYYFAGYTYFVAAIYWLAGHAPAAIRMIQAVIGTLTVGLVYVLGRSIFSHRPAIIAAILTTVSLPLVYYEGLILTETWFLFLQMLALVVWLGAWGVGPVDGGDLAAEPGAASASPPPEYRRTHLAAAVLLAATAGLIAGLACLTRAAFVLALGTLAAGGLWLPPVPASRGRRIVLVAVFLICAGAAIAPVTVRNYQIHHRFILISTNGPSTFLTGHVTHVPWLQRDLPADITDAEMAERDRKRVLRYLDRNLGTYLAEIPECFKIVWTDNEFWPETTNVWNNESYPNQRLDLQVHLYGSPPAPRVTYFPDLVRVADRLVWTIIGLPMAMLAVLFLPRRNRRWTVLYLALVPYFVIPFIAYPFPRYRLPAVPLCYVLAGQAMIACWDCRRLRLRNEPGPKPPDGRASG